MKKRSVIFLSLHIVFWLFNFTRKTSECEAVLHAFLNQLGMLSVFYLNYFVLVPNVVKKDKPAYYLLWIFLLFAIFWIVKILDFVLMPEADLCEHQKQSVFYGFGVVSYYSFYFGGVSAVLRLGYDLFEIEDQNKVLLMQKTNTQIQFMKSNINIPFIVQALTHLEDVARQDPEYIKEPLLQLSSLLRYGTYDATLDNIELEKELGVLQEFIDLINQIENGYQIMLSFKDIGCQLKTVPNLLIKIIGYWRDQVSCSLSGEILIEITGFCGGMRMHLPVAGSFNLADLNLNFPEICNNFFNTKYSYSGNILAVDIIPVSK